MPSLAALVLPLLLFLCCGGSFSEATDAGDKKCPSQCGRHNICCPFRLKDSLNNCNGLNYTLSCEDDDQLILYSESGNKFRVQSINYNNSTIRLTDANHNYSSLIIPPHSSFRYYSSNYDDLNLYSYQFRQDGSTVILVKQMLYIRCPHDRLVLESSSDAVTCTNGSAFYVIDIEESLWDLGLRDSCCIEGTYLTSWPAAVNNPSNNFSCTDIRNMLLYGFELSWPHFSYGETFLHWLGN